MWDFLSGILGFGGKFVEGEYSKANTEKNNQTQLAIAAQNIALQREFAQHGIQWKVADAVSAGLHPLIGAGAQSQSFSPVSVGTEAAPTPKFGEMGQDLGRALKAAMSQEDRAEHDEATGRKLALEKAGLENDILRADLASKLRRETASNGQLGPPMPSSTTVSGRVPLPRPGPARTVSSGAAVADDDIKQKEEDYPATKIVRPFGYPLYTNPWFGDGQSFEDRYGESEIGSTIKFGVNTLADHVYTGYRHLPSAIEWASGPRRRRQQWYRERR